MGAPVIDALGLPHRRITTPEELEEIVPTAVHARLTKKPVVLSLARDLLR